MTTSFGFLRLNRLRIIQSGHVAYDKLFHEGVNIIRGQNGSGKSTLADFIFFILGGDFKDWKDAASNCDEAQAEIETPRGKLTLKRQIKNSQEPIFVYFGPMANVPEISLEGWERFPIRRQSGQKSFSQVMFHSLLIPEAQSEGAANITMHQLLRLCYSDQRTPAARLFRFESFDTQNLRLAVGNLICGISGYEVYEIDLKLRESQKKLADINVRLKGLHDALPSDEALNTPELILTEINSLKNERFKLQQQVDNVDNLINPGDVKNFLVKRRKSQTSLIKQREKLKTEELKEKSIEFELREINEFVKYLRELEEKLTYAEITCDAIGSIEFMYCPACGEQLDLDVSEYHCVVCKSPIDQEREISHYNLIRLDLEIQMRESEQLVRQKKDDLFRTRQILRQLRRKHENDLSNFDLKYAGGNGPREAFLATKINRMGHIDASINFLHKSLDIAEEISKLNLEKAMLVENINSLTARNEALQQEVNERRYTALSKISNFGASILRADLPRQSEFKCANSVKLNFRNDSITVDGLVNFAESSNVILKNTALFGLFLAAGTNPQFYHPRFLLIDNIEDKGMEVDRSHAFQRIIVERASQLEIPYQIIFTTSMMNPDLELDDYTIGPPYTNTNRVLHLMK